ncbi:MAG: AbrB/MazE/SpoVT family DNA-binding domain-containing protein [Dehalococcoidia bacterium]
MGILAKLTSGGQVTLPKEIRTRANMQAGDFVEVELGEEGYIVLKPKKLVDATQAYFWTRQWQEGERKADGDIKAGRVRKFRSAAEAVRYLDGGTQGEGEPPGEGKP